MFLFLGFFPDFLCGFTFIYIYIFSSYMKNFQIFLDSLFYYLKKNLDYVLIIVHNHLTNPSLVFSLHLLCGSQTMIPLEVI
jgi:hypothetical protein